MFLGQWFASFSCLHGETFQTFSLPSTSHPAPPSLHPLPQLCISASLLSLVGTTTLQLTAPYVTLPLGT